MEHFERYYEERYFIGIEFAGGVTPDKIDKIPSLWEEFMSDLSLLKPLPLKRKFIGLECYPPDFKDVWEMEYYAMVQTESQVEHSGFVTKKLPKGNYLHFNISFDHLRDDIQNVYAYLKEHQIKFHKTFDYEEYLEDEDYSKSGARLNFCFLLDES